MFMVKDPILEYSSSTVREISASVSVHRAHRNAYDLKGRKSQYPCYNGFHEGPAAAVRGFNLIPETLGSGCAS
jgi:hypothetical protein